MAENVFDHRRTNFTMVSNAVIKSDSITKPADLAVYVIICMHAGNKTRQSFLKVETIAKEAHMSTRTVHRSLKVLEGAGFIKITRQHRPDGTRKNSEYHVLDI